VEVRRGVDWVGSGEKICLATGSVAGIPSGFPKPGSSAWTSNEAIDADKIPPSLLVVGGGVIGLELGQIFHEFGTKVTIVEMVDQIIPGLDSNVSKRLQAVFKKQGIEILVNQRIHEIHEEGNGISARIGNEMRKFSKVLYATGRKPNLSIKETSNLEFRFKEGFLDIDQKFETNIPGIFAIGDCVPGPMLAHKASYDAAVLAEIWGGKTVSPNYQLIPSCVYTYPEIACVGLSEDEAKRRGLPVKIGRSLFSANGKAQASGESEGQVKTIFSEDGKLLGAVIWGPEASNLIIEAAVSINAQTGLEEFSKIVHPHPTLSEAFQEAFENAFGKNIHG